MRGPRSGIDVGCIRLRAFAETLASGWIERRRVPAVRAMPVAAVMQITMTRQHVGDVRTHALRSLIYFCLRAVCAPPPVFAS